MLMLSPLGDKTEIDMVDVIAVAVIALIVGGAVGYIIWAKKKGRHCIGCPDSKTCGGKCTSCPHSQSTENK